jgi:peptidoglycan/xylan/chitin deacetylase (PgdA/CDA1 family)
MLGIGRFRYYAKWVRSYLRRNTIILLYHRVADVPTDPQLLCVTPKKFSEQMQVLRGTWNPVSLPQLSAGVRHGRLPRRSILVTFDDGYADNLHSAKPILEQYEIPATVFVAAGYLGIEREYWWDELEQLLLQPRVLPEQLSFRLNGTTFEWKLGKSAVFYSEQSYQEYADWNLQKKTVPTERHALYLDLYKALRPLASEQRDEMLEMLSQWSGCNSVVRETHRPMTVPEVQKLRDGDLISIGAHTMSHPVLSSLPIDAQRKEISGSRNLLEDIVGHSVTSFAYPYGRESDYTQESVTAVADAGFELAFSTSSGLIGKKSEPFRLPRIYVGNWDGDAFANRLQQWFL